MQTKSHQLTLKEQEKTIRKYCSKSVKDSNETARTPSA